MPEQIRLEKQVAIARSGVQYYTRQEVRAMGVTIPKEFDGKKFFGVYRPAALLAAKKDLFASQPFINTHKGFVNPQNYTKWAQGWVGDTITLEMNDAKTEAVIKGDLKILGAEAIDAYESGTREVSPHYFGIYDWEPGTSPDGLEYHVVAKDLTMVNHLALVPKGRGGPDAAIEDRAPGPFSWIWKHIEKLFGQKDEEMPSFRQHLEEISKLRGTLSDEQIREKAEVLYKCVDKMPWDEDKDLLYRFLGDINLLTDDRSDEEAAEYVKIVADLYEKSEERTLKEIMQSQKTAVEKAQEDAMAEENKDKPEEKELNEFMAKVKDHIAGGGKLSDWKATKDEEPSDEEKKKAEEKKAADAKAAKDAEEAEAKKVEEEKKKEEEKAKKEEAEAKDHMALAAVYDAYPPNTVTLDFARHAPKGAAATKALEAIGFFGRKKES